MQKAIREVLQNQSNPYYHSHVFELQIAGFGTFSSRLCSLEFLLLFFKKKEVGLAGYEAEEFYSEGISPYNLIQ